MAACVAYDEADDLTRCSVCLIEFDDFLRRAKFLVCFHTFCVQCLQSMVRSSNQMITCPTCHQLTSCPDGVIALPTNSYAVQILKMKQPPVPMQHRDQSWCFGCCSFAKPSCQEKSSHIIVPMGTSSLKGAQGLTAVFNSIQEDQASTATKIKQIQDYLNSVLLAIKVLEDRIKDQLELNDIQLAEIASSLDTPNFVLDRQRDTIDFLKDELVERAFKSKAERDVIETAVAEIEAQSTTRILVKLTDASSTCSIPTLPLFENGFIPSELEGPESLKRPLSVLSYVVFSLLADKNVSILSKKTPASAQTSVSEPSSSSANLEQTQEKPSDSTGLVPRPMQPAKNFIIGQSFFKLKFKRQGKFLGGEVHVLPSPSFDHSLLLKLGNACFKKPTNFSTFYAKAFGNGFLQMEFISHDRAHHIAAHKLPESGRPANEPYEVGVSSAFLNAITQGIHSVVFIFLLPLFRDHVNDKPIHFGKVIQGDAMIRNLSFMPKADREGITAIIEAI